MLQKIFCFIGIHQWIYVDRDLDTPLEKIERTYQQCEKCRRYGKLIHYKVIKDIWKK